MEVNHDFSGDCPGEAKLGSHRLKKEQGANPRQECNGHELGEGSRRPLLLPTPGQQPAEELLGVRPQRETLKAEETQPNT